MTHDHLRRRLSLALPAFVFLFFALVETVEVRAMTEALFSLGSAQEEPARDAKTCKSVRIRASEA